MIVFAAEDGKVNGKHYDELAVFICSGYGWRASSSIIEETKMVKNSGFDTWEQWMQRNKEGLYYVVSARREKDCVLVSIRNELITLEARVLLSADDTRDIYISFTGEQCDIQDMVVE